MLNRIIITGYHMQKTSNQKQINCQRLKKPEPRAFLSWWLMIILMLSYSYNFYGRITFSFPRRYTPSRVLFSTLGYFFFSSSSFSLLSSSFSASSCFCRSNSCSSSLIFYNLSFVILCANPSSPISSNFRF